MLLLQVARVDEGVERMGGKKTRSTRLPISMARLSSDQLARHAAQLTPPHRVVYASLLRLCRTRVVASLGVFAFSPNQRHTARSSRPAPVR